MNQLDRLYGGAGADLFVLGTSSTFAGSAFTEGMAFILDFNRAEGDKIQVYGSASDYTLSPFFSGTSIAYQGDVIGVVNTSITVSDLNFVAPIMLPPNIFPPPIVPFPLII